MTIAELVSHFGATTPRYVTIDGQIVFNDVAPVASGGYSHAEHGPVTPVPKHTFHGGAEETDRASDTTATWWDDPALIERHLAAMQRSFPCFEYEPPQDGGAPAWFDQIDTGRGKFVIGVILRADQGLPRIAMLSKMRLGASAGRGWVRSPHLYDNGNLCVADNGEWTADEFTAATTVAWAAHWLAAYTEWRITRKWPVSGVEAVAA